MSEDDAAFCAALAREHDFQRYAASLFTSASNRRALLALAAFGIEIARIADQVSQPMAGEIRLQWWTDALQENEQGNEHGGAAGNPVAAELLRAMADHALPVEPLTRLIDARRFDLYSDPMPNASALEVYLDDVHGTLFAQAARILGDAEAAGDAGLARGIADMLTRLPRDAARRRCFLPLNENDAAELFEGRGTPALHMVRDEMIASAQDALQRARAHFKSARPAWLPLATLARELDRLQRSDPLTPPAPPSRLRVLTSQWWMARG